MQKFFYVYIIVSVRDPDRYYIGFTEDLRDRLEHHNYGAVPSTKPHRPWRFRTCTAFTDKARALAYERYLKTHSGRAFIAKRL